MFIKNKRGTFDNILIYDNCSFPYNALFTDVIETRLGPKRTKLEYLKDFMTLDIETTTIDKSMAYAYTYQVDLFGQVLFVRNIQDFMDFILKINETLKLGEKRRLVCYVHNLSFEFQFLKDFLNPTSIFATDTRKVCKFLAYNIEFRCSYLLTNLSLGVATKKYGCEHPKAIDDLDYNVRRTPITPMTETEIGYCVLDVISLRELIQILLNMYNDDITTIPLTQTGYPRRDVRVACHNAKYYKRYFKKWRLTPECYNQLMKTKRGGNTHANRYLSDLKLGETMSFDFTSSYPYEILTSDQYPNTPFSFWGSVTSKQLQDYFYNEVLNKYASMFQLIMQNVKIKDNIYFPYISSSTCEVKENVTEDNGRILSAKTLSLYITNIDYNIIKQQYDFDESIANVWIASKGMLPEEIRNVTYRYFVDKCDIKGELNRLKHEAKETTQEYADTEALYMASKQKLNGIFGMLYTCPINDNIIYEAHEWNVEPADREKALEKYYKRRRNFANFQWGVWTAALARKHLQDMLDIAGEYAIYCDTDSIKLKVKGSEKVRDKFEEHNIRVKALDNAKNVSYKDKDGNIYYLGLFDYEGTYKEFKTLGAKKYACTDDKGKLHITISGVDKALGEKAIGTIDNFEDGFNIEDSGGNILYYNEADPHEIYIDGCEITTASSISLLPRHYQISIGDDYSRVIDFVRKGGFDHVYRPIETNVNNRHELAIQ